MKVLVALEFSGIVRDAFIARGHDAISCDLLPSEKPGPHYQGDIRDIIGDGFDLMIAHPPCTHLAVSGARYFYRKEREQAEALDFVRFLMGVDIPRVCIENPVSVISTRIRKPDQIIQPWMFGHGEAKATCLWLKNLPPLKPTSIVEPDFICGCGHRFPAALVKYGCPNCAGDNVAVKRVFANQTPSGQNRIGPSPTAGAASLTAL